MKPIDIDSLLDIHFISAPGYSPDGRYIACIASQADDRENRYRSCIHLIDRSTGASRQMTFSGNESGYTWEDGYTLLFAAERAEADKPEKGAEKTVFYRLDVTGGEASRAFELPLKALEIRCIGEGRYIALADVDLNAPAGDMDETLRGDLKDYHVLEEAPFWSNGKGFVSRHRRALFLFDAKSGKCEKLTEPFFDVESFDVRGERLVYTGALYRDVRSAFGRARLCDLKSGDTRDLIGPDRYSVGAALLTERAVMLPMTTMGPWGLEQLKDWYRYDPETGDLRLLAQMQYHVGSVGVLDCAFGGGSEAVAVGESVFFIAQRGSCSEVCRLTPQGEVARLAPFDGNAIWLTAHGDDIAIVGHPRDGLGELYALKDGEWAQISDHNGAFLRAHRTAKAEYMPFTNPAGDRIDGWLLRPADFDPDKRYPGVLEIHGGPRCTYGAALHHEMQALCAAGYLVFFCNPRGSEGYGEAFADLRGKYGTVDYEDLMAFTDHVLDQVPQLDSRRLAACGGSYGGFMCNWIEGHTDRFAAIASQRSISNWVSDFGTSEIGIGFDKNEMGADPWTDMEAMWRQSPLKYAADAKTPILFIHSMCDYNCTLDQGLEMFTAMKYFGVPTRMCLFEGENHSLSRSGKPRHRIRRLEEILGWFGKYLAADTTDGGAVTAER